jgi:hypothetical protein
LIRGRNNFAVALKAASPRNAPITARSWLYIRHRGSVGRDDYLPELASLGDSAEFFDLLMLTASGLTDQRERGTSRVTKLINAAGFAPCVLEGLDKRRIIPGIAARPGFAARPSKDQRQTDNVQLRVLSRTTVALAELLQQSP